MPAVKQLKIPQSPTDITLAWVQDVAVVINQILASRVVVSPTNTTRGVESLTISGEGIIVPIPVQLASAITNPTGGGTIDAQCRAALIKLFDQERATGRLPS